MNLLYSQHFNKKGKEKKKKKRKPDESVEHEQ